MTQPQLSIATCFDYEIPIEAQLPLVAEAGFTHISLGARESHAGYLSISRRRRLRQLLEVHGLRIDSIHAPCTDAPDTVETLSEVAEAAADLGAPVVVMHGGPPVLPKDELPARLDVLLRTCEKLEPVAAGTSVKFAIENLQPGPGTDIVRKALPQLVPEHFGFCYDSCHGRDGDPKPFGLLDDLGDRLAAVHLSDRSSLSVRHSIPGEGIIEWAHLAEQLGRCRFAEPLLFEVVVSQSEEKDVRRFLKRTYEQGMWLWDHASAAASSEATDADTAGTVDG